MKETSHKNSTITSDRPGSSRCHWFFFAMDFPFFPLPCGRSIHSGTNESTTFVVVLNHPKIILNWRFKRSMQIYITMIWIPTHCHIFSAFFSHTHESLKAILYIVSCSFTIHAGKRPFFRSSKAQSSGITPSADIGLQGTRPHPLDQIAYLFVHTAWESTGKKHLWIGLTWYKRGHFQCLPIHKLHQRVSCRYGLIMFNQFNPIPRSYYPLLVTMVHGGFSYEWEKGYIQLYLYDQCYASVAAALITG